MKEQKTTKRLLSILLCLVLMIGMLPTMALAEEAGYRVTPKQTHLNMRT